MSEKKKRNTAAVVVGSEYHTALNMYFKKNGVPKKYQVEFALLNFYKEKAPEIFESLNKKKDGNP